MTNARKDRFSYLTSISFMLFVCIALLVTMSDAYAQIGCGSTITSSLKLNSDLVNCDQGITIGANKVTLDCAGHSLTASAAGSASGSGVHLSHVTGVTLKNCFLYQWEFGVFVDGGSSNRIVGNIAVLNLIGFLAEFSSKNTFTRNTASTNSGPGFELETGIQNTLSSNSALSNVFDGFTIDSTSFGNVFSGNDTDSNIDFGFGDDSTGAGTGGTANSYKNNTCNSNNGGLAQSFPAGLC